MKKNIKQSHDNMPEILPVIPTMDIVVFPRMIVPLLVLDERIIKGIQKSIDDDTKKVFLIASRKQSHNHQGAIGTKDLYEIGTIGSIMRLIRIPEGGIKILVQGIEKGHVSSIAADQELLNATVHKIACQDDLDTPEINALIKNIKAISETMSLAGQSLSPDFNLII